MNVLQRQARPAVGRKPRAEHQLLQRRFAHLGHHGGGLRVGALGVEREEHRVVVAAAGQPQLGVEQLGFVVDSARGQARQAPGAVGVIALAAFHAQGAEAIHRAGLVGDVELGFVLVGVDLGAAAGDAGGGVAAGLQLAQAIGFGGVPGGLGEGLPGRERPVALHALLLAGTGLGVLAGRWGAAREVDVGAGNAGLGPGLHGDDHGARRGFALGSFRQLDRDRGRKVPHRAQQLACIGVGRAQQALQLAGIQVGQVAKALQLQVALERAAYFVRRAHVHCKRR